MQATNGVTSVQQIIASSTGAMLTSLFTTPLDVVKVRLQSQVKAPYLPQHIFCEMYCTGLLNHFCGRQSVAAAPGEDCATRNARNLTPRFKGTVDTLFKISRQEGIRTLWAGLPPTLIMTVPSTVLYFTTYEQIKSKLHETRLKNYAIVPIVAGAVARLCAVTVISPIELIRTKLQSEKLNYRYIQKAIIVTVKREGILSLWRGWGATILRDVPFSCVYWFHYETFKKYILSRNKTTELPIMWAFASGAVAGTIAGTITLPFDVVKTHRQIELGEQLSVHPRAVRKETKDTFSVLMNLYRQRGPAALFSGVAPRIAKVAPSCAIMISSYEFFKSYFRKKNLGLSEDAPSAHHLMLQKLPSVDDGMEL